MLDVARDLIERRAHSGDDDDAALLTLELFHAADEVAALGATAAAFLLLNCREALLEQSADLFHLLAVRSNDADLVQADSGPLVAGKGTRER